MHKKAREAMIPRAYLYLLPAGIHFGKDLCSEFFIFECTLQIVDTVIAQKIISQTNDFGAFLFTAFFAALFTLAFFFVCVHALFLFFC